MKIDKDPADARRRSRALVTVVVLFAFVILLYAITIVKLTGRT